MSREAFERGDWQTVIAAHALESHDPEEWLRYGVALLQTIEAGPDVGKQQQQAALAFVQAKREGASEDAVAAAQRHSVLISLQEALIVAGMASTAAAVKQRWEAQLDLGRTAAGKLAQCSGSDQQPERDPGVSATGGCE
jgi:hypothetical protein